MLSKMRSYLLVGIVCLALLGVAAWLTLTPAPAFAQDPVVTEESAAVSASPAVTTTIPSMSGNLDVAAAASLTECFTEMATQLEGANPDLKITFNFAGSQQLAQQINQGAPADVFASANKKQMGVAIESGRIVSGTEQIFTSNRLVVVYPADNPAKIATLQDLTKSGLRLVLAAAEVPVGEYTVEFLDKAVKDPEFGASYKDDVLKNVVSYEQNVKAVLTKVVLGEADAGIVYSTDAATDKDGKSLVLDIPDALNSVATYPIAVLSDSPQPELAQTFVDYVLSPAGQDSLAAFGFIPVIK